MADENNNLDVNGTAQTEQAQSTAESSTANGVQTGQESKTTQTLESVIADVVKASDSSPEEKAEKSAVQSLNKTQEGEKKEGEEKVDASQSKKEGEGEEGDKKGAEQEVVEGQPVPYDRFKEVNGKYQELVAESELVKPLLEAQKGLIEFCQNNQITSDEYRFWMNVAAMAKNDPAKALEALKPQMEQLQGFTGDKLPEDLQKLVDNGELPLAVAKRLTAAENKLQFGQKQVQKSQEQLFAEKQQQETTRMTGVFNSWAKTQSSTDPDFQPKKDASSPDGKFEMFLYKFKADADEALKSGKLKNETDMIKVAEGALKAVNGTVQSMLPKSKNTTQLHSTRSKSTPTPAPKSLDDVTAQVAAKHGLSYAVPTR